MSSDCQEICPLQQPVILDLSGTPQAAAGHLNVNLGNMILLF
jgi:hypothetical protein